jgi:hypothetical protein
LEQQQWLETVTELGEIHKIDKIADGDLPETLIARVMAEEEDNYPRGQ